MITSVLEKYNQFKKEPTKVSNPVKLIFKGVEGFDVYNITAPFKQGNDWVIAGRVEKRDSEYSTIRFFKKQSEDTYEVIANTPELSLQDPFFTYIDDKLVLGGVFVTPSENDPSRLIWKTQFFVGNDIFDLKHIFDGPVGMKDIRLCQVSKDKIVVFTRPQGEVGGRGTIGVAQISNLSELSLSVIENAKLLDEQFQSQDWGGANAAYVLDTNTIGVLSHVAMFDDDDNRHYYPSTFKYNVETGQYSEIKIICERSDFLEGESKRDDLVDVVFSGGLIKLQQDQYQLYAGISDCEAQFITINNPF